MDLHKDFFLHAIAASTLICYGSPSPESEISASATGVNGYGI